MLFRSRVAYKQDKSVAVIYPAPKSRKEKELESEWLDRVFGKAMQGDLSGLPYDDIDVLELPQSREDRDAWIGEKGKGISIDVEKAKAIKDSRLHAELIAKKQREMAVNELKVEGKIPSDYKAE